MDNRVEVNHKKEWVKFSFKDRDPAVMAAIRAYLYEINNRDVTEQDGKDREYWSVIFTELADIINPLEIKEIDHEKALKEIHERKEENAKSTDERNQATSGSEQSTDAGEGNDKQD